MKKRKYAKTELGLLYGITIGAAIAVVMFAITSNTLWFGAIGAGLALGLGIGASLDKNAG